MGHHYTGRKHIHPGVTLQRQHDHRLMGHELTTALDEQMREGAPAAALPAFKGLFDRYASAVEQADILEIKSLEIQLGQLRMAHAGLSALIAESHLDRN